MNLSLYSSLTACYVFLYRKQVSHSVNNKHLRLFIPIQDGLFDNPLYLTSDMIIFSTSYLAQI